MRKNPAQKDRKKDRQKRDRVRNEDQKDEGIEKDGTPSESQGTRGMNKTVVTKAFRWPVVTSYCFYVSNYCFAVRSCVQKCKIGMKPLKQRNVSRQ